MTLAASNLPEPPDTQPQASTLTAALESILFVAGDPAPVDRLRAALGCSEGEIESAIAALSDQLRTRGVRLQRMADTVQLVSAPENAVPVEKFLGIQATSRPSAAALEVLAIVAYRQPVSRIQIDEVRGVSSDRAIRSLLAQGLIQEVGRGSGVGRPVLYGTSEVFLQRFGLAGIDQLPEIEGEASGTPPDPAASA